MVPTVTLVTLYGMVVIMYLMAAGATWICWRGDLRWDQGLDEGPLLVL